MKADSSEAAVEITLQHGVVIAIVAKFNCMRTYICC